MAEPGVDHVVLYGANRSGSAVSWLTGWPVTREAHVLVTPGEPDVLLVGFYNHVPEARRRAPRRRRRFAGDDPAATLASCCASAARRSAGRAGRAAAVGPARRPGRAPRRSSTSRGRTPGCGCGSPPRRSPRCAPRPRSPTSAAAALVDGPVAGRTEHELTARHRGRLRRPGRHAPHPLPRRHADGGARAVGAGPVAARPPGRGGRPAHLRALAPPWRPEYSGQLLRTVTVGAEPSRRRPRAARRRRGGAGRDRGAAAARRARRGTGRGRRGDRGRRAHHRRRPGARLRRRLPATGARVAQPRDPADAGPEAGGRHDRRRPAQRGDAGPAARRADRRAAAGHRRRRRSGCTPSRAGWCGRA